MAKRSFNAKRTRYGKKTSHVQNRFFLLNEYYLTGNEGIACPNLPPLLKCENNNRLHVKASSSHRCIYALTQEQEYTLHV